MLRETRFSLLIFRSTKVAAFNINGHGWRAWMFEVSVRHKRSVFWLIFRKLWFLSFELDDVIRFLDSVNCFFLPFGEVVRSSILRQHPKQTTGEVSCSIQKVIFITSQELINYRFVRKKIFVLDDTWLMLSIKALRWVTHQKWFSTRSQINVLLLICSFTIRVWKSTVNHRVGCIQFVISTAQMHIDWKSGMLRIIGAGWITLIEIVIQFAD